MENIILKLFHLNIQKFIIIIYDEKQYFFTNVSIETYVIHRKENKKFLLLLNSHINTH